MGHQKKKILLVPQGFRTQRPKTGGCFCNSHFDLRRLKRNFFQENIEAKTQACKINIVKKTHHDKDAPNWPSNFLN